MGDADLDDTVEQAAGTGGEIPGPPERAPAGVFALAEAVSVLGERIQAYDARAEARERVIDQLHAEVERLRAGEQGIALRPIVTDLQNLRGELLRQVRTVPAEIDREQVVRLLDSFALDVELALERCGSLPVRPGVGEKFSGREHRVMKAVEAACVEEDGTIAEVLADGYQDISTGRVLAAAKVHVRRWNGSAKPAQQTPADEESKANKHELKGSTDV